MLTVSKNAGYQELLQQAWLAWNALAGSKQVAIRGHSNKLGLPGMRQLFRARWLSGVTPTSLASLSVLADSKKAGHQESLQQAWFSWIELALSNKLVIRSYSNKLDFLGMH